jgi:hypothetical protein
MNNESGRLRKERAVFYDEQYSRMCAATEENYSKLQPE